MRTFAGTESLAVGGNQGLVDAVVLLQTAQGAVGAVIGAADIGRHAGMSVRALTTLPEKREHTQVWSLTQLPEGSKHTYKKYILTLTVIP